MSDLMNSAVPASDPTGNAAAVSVETLYDVLGVEESATQDEIKRAYFRLVRQYRPSEHPDIFQKFNDASRTLGDSRKRGEYDQVRRSGRQMKVLLDQAAASFEKDQLKSITLLKSAVALAPDAPRPRAMIAHALMRMEEYAGAERQYHWLLRESPRDETLHYKLARCLWLQKRTEDAESQLNTALRYNPCYHDALMLLSQLCEGQGRNQEAVTALEKAIENDGRENYADFDALLRLLGFYLVVEGGEPVERTVERLVAIIPNENPEKRHQAVQRLFERAREYVHAERYSVALSLLDIAAQPGDVGDDLRAEITALRRQVAAVTEARRLDEDKLLEGALKAVFQLKYLDKSSEAKRKGNLEAVLNTLQDELSTDPRGLARAIDYVNREYPTLAAEQAVLLSEIAGRIEHRIAATGPKTKTAAKTFTTMPAAAASPEKPREPKPESTARRGFFGWRKNAGDGTVRPAPFTAPDRLGEPESR